jgi:recombination protein RecA
MSEDFMKDAEEARLVKTSRKSSLKFIKTSYQPLDDALGGGIPLGKVTDIAGEPGVGKTALIYDIIRQAQLDNLRCVYLDIDRKFDGYWARERSELDVDDLLVFEPKKTEGIVPACLGLIQDGYADLIIFDSISALDIEGSLKDILNPLLQKIVESKTAIIFTSQLRQDMENGGMTTPQNTILDQVCNVRMMLKKSGMIKQHSEAVKGDIVIGYTVEVNVYKNDLKSPAVEKIEIYH